MTILETVKMLLEIPDDSKDALLEHLCESVESAVRSDCQYNETETMPNGMKLLIIDIVVDQSKAGAIGTLDTDSETSVQQTGIIKSKTMGDVKIEYTKSSSSTSSLQAGASSTFLNDYKTRIRKFRKVIGI